MVRRSLPTMDRQKREQSLYGGFQQTCAVSSDATPETAQKPLSLMEESCLNSSDMGNGKDEMKKNLSLYKYEDVSQPQGLQGVSMSHKQVMSRGKRQHVDMPMAEDYTSAEGCYNSEAPSSLKQQEELCTIDLYISLLLDCRKKKQLQLAKDVILHICSAGVDCVEELGNGMVAMLVVCGSMHLAHQVFRKLDIRSELSWTYLIRASIEKGLAERAILLFREMQEDEVPASRFTFLALLKACARLRRVREARALYMEIVKVGLEVDYHIGNASLDVFAKCRSLAEVQYVFQKIPTIDAISWTALMSAYLEKGLSQEALGGFDQMLEAGISPDGFAFIYSLKACGNLQSKDKGREVHALLVMEGYEGDPLVGNALVDMYVKCGLVTEAQDVFNDLPVQDVVTWTSLISGCAEQGENVRALSSYYRMQEQGFLPNDMTFASVLKACGNIIDVDTGRRLHSQICGLAKCESFDTITATALINMYAKCGSMPDAQQVFTAMPTRDLVGWNALMTGYTDQGEGEAVFQLFDKMKEEGIRPDDVTYLNALTACCYAGLLDRGKSYFDALCVERGINASIKHYNCMVNLLGKAGKLKEALMMLQTMPFEPDLLAWVTLLAACRKWGNVQMGRQAFDATMKIDAKHIPAINAMFNIYVEADMWEEAKKIEAMRVNLGAGRELKKSSI